MKLPGIGCILKVTVLPFDVPVLMEIVIQTIESLKPCTEASDALSTAKDEGKISSLRLRLLRARVVAPARFVCQS